MARTPLYKAAETEMISRIAKGDWEVGRRLPNEFILAEEFGVSQGTMRRALISLEQSGYLSRKPGRGTLVATQAPTDTAAPSVTPVLLGVDGKALSLTPFRGRADTRAATPEEAKALGTDRVAVLERTLKHKGRRAALETTIVPVDLIAALDEDAPVPLDALLAHHDVMAARLTAEAGAEVTDMAKSVALSVDRHCALLVVHTDAFAANGTMIARQILQIALEDARLAHQ
ncbi:GntR family transcriptional regulator [Rhodobacteraceae bacterium M385]|nr:GntR family transcriptional regulator [Rhodobacteraceae bacterium M385]